MSTPLRRSGAALVLPLALSLLLPLAACGQGRDDHPAGHEATDPTDEPTSEPASPTDSATPTETPTTSDTEPEAATQQSGPVPVTGNAGVERAVVVSGSEVGGQLSPLAFALQTPQERKDFAASFKGGFGRKVSRAALAMDIPAGTMRWGTVAAVGCEGPDSVRIDAGEAGFEVTPNMPKSTVQCLVPVTYVVVFAAPTA